MIPARCRLGPEHHFRPIPAGVVEAPGPDDEHIGHGWKRHIDRRAASGAKRPALDRPAITGEIPGCWDADKSDLGAGKGQVGRVPGAAVALALPALAIV